MRQRIRVMVLVAALAGASGCRSRSAGVPDLGPADAAPRLATAELATDHTTQLAALALAHRDFAPALGAHRMELTSKLAVSGGRTVRQNATLRVDASGQYAAVKHTHPQYGTEVIWTGGWLYPRARHSKFLKRRPRPGETARTSDRMVGLLPAYLDLLGRFIAITVSNPSTKHDGRAAVALSLKRRAKPSRLVAATVKRAPRRWRKTVDVRTLSGNAVVDKQTGAPLSVDLSATWKFAPPASHGASNGIPSRTATAASATMSLTFTQRIRGIGVATKITAPDRSEVLVNPRRLRREIERQMLLGERPVDPRWRIQTGEAEAAAPASQPTRAWPTR